MVLPLYLAMTAEEMANAPALPRYFGRMASCADWLTAPGLLPAGAMLILHDQVPLPRIPALPEALQPPEGGILLDLEQEPTVETLAVVNQLSQALSCPLAAPPGFIGDTGRTVFLPPCPLHVPLAEYLKPWQSREIWLDFTLQQQTITVTPEGTRYGSPAPADRPDEGVLDDVLLCQCVTEISEDAVRFTLFDTPNTLTMKLEEAAKLGVSRAVGLYQELKFKL